MLTIWVTYFLAAVAASGVFVAIGWRSKRSRAVAATQGRPALPYDPLWGDTEIDIAGSESRTDVAGAIRLALKRLAPVMASQSVRVDVAAPSGLVGRMRPAALVDLLEELLAAAIHAAPASRLLLTAAARRDYIFVGISDDRPAADPAVRAGNVRGLIERVALRGGILDIAVRPAEGTTMTLRIAAATEQRLPEKDSPRPQPVLKPTVHAALFD